MVLVYSKTDTKWWHKYVEGKAEVHNIQGRLQFLDDTGKPKMYWNQAKQRLTKGYAPYPSCWIIYRKQW